MVKSKDVDKRAAHWREVALALPASDPPNLGVPLVVFLGEAVVAAKFVREHWETETDPKTDTVLRLGLSTAEKSVEGPASFTLRIADEILELHEEIQRAQTRQLLATKAGGDASADMSRAAFIISEMSAALEWAFDDGVEDDKDAQLSAVETAHANDGDTVLERASLLSDYRALAHKYRTEIDGVLGFDVALIEEASELTKTLRGLGESKPDPDEDAAREPDLRNRLLRLLEPRVKRVRKAARLVYRNAPEIARAVTSAYQRRTRAAQRRSKAAEQPDGEDPKG